MNRAEYLESPLLRAAGFRHAFFTRRGGVSEGAYESLNFSFTVGDSHDHVTTNLARGATALGVPAERMYFLAQVHGRQVRVLGGEETWGAVVESAGDALVSRCPTLACCVRIADCVPVLVGDEASGAVAAVHAGWRGTVAGVVGAAVAALRREGARLVAAIGPHISRAAFEVSEEVAAELERASSARGVVDRTPGTRPHVDLSGIVRAQLVEAGVAEAAIDLVEGCTVGQPESFFSYRRDGTQSGRHLAGIVPR
jgi:polyphenol oxidase